MDSKRGATFVAVRRTKYGWYIMVGEMAVCSYHGPVHLHRHFESRHPDHLPKVPVNPGLDDAHVLARVRRLCDAMDREPTFEELREALA